MPENTPRLIVRDASGTDREVELTQLPFTIGRQGDSDLVVLDNRISRHHARITQDGDHYILEDTQSRHGTFVNGERIESSILKNEDQISLGVTDSYQIIFLTEEPVLPTILQTLEKATTTGPGTELQRLGLLLQMAQMLHRAPALEEVLTTLVDNALRLTDAERGLLFLREQQGDLYLRLARGRGGVSLGSNVADYSREVVERVIQSGREQVAVEEVSTGRTTQETMVFSGAMRDIVAVPLQKLPMLDTSYETLAQTSPELLGILYLDSRTGATSLTGLDRQVLATFAMEGATVIENARLFKLTREQERIQHELDLARNIQRSLLPRQLPKSAYFELHAITLPSRTVGGDYYDILSLPGDRFGINVADVSGKGLPSAMMAATLQGAFAAVALGAPDLEELFLRVNDLLCDRTPLDMYATLFYGVLCPTGRFSFVSAGHPPSLIVRAGSGSVEPLDNANFPMGLFPGAPFTSESIKLEPGDNLVIYSDGITEAQNEEDEFFGEARLKEVLKGGAGRGAAEVCGRVMTAINAFVGHAPQADDITLVVLRLGPPGR